MSNIMDLEEWLNEKKRDQGAYDLLFLTQEQIRSVPDFKDAPDEEIQNIINSLHNLALLTYRIVSNELDQQMLEKQAA